MESTVDPDTTPPTNIITMEIPFAPTMVGAALGTRGRRNKRQHSNQLAQDNEGVVQ